MKHTLKLLIVVGALQLGGCGGSTPRANSNDGLNGNNGDCPVGSVGCVCNHNDRCISDAICLAGTCELDINSSLGDHGQACYGDGSCDGDLACADGLCVFESSTTIATNLHWPVDFLVNQGNAYWSDQLGHLYMLPLSVDGLCPTASKIMRTRKDNGGNPEVLASNRRRPGGLRLSDDHLYWIEHGEHPELDPVVTMPTSGGSIQTIQEGVNGANDICVDDTYVFFTNAVEYGSPTGMGVVTRATKPAGAPSAITSQLGGLRWVYSDSAQLYWANASGEITRAERDGSNPTTLTIHPRTISFVMLDDATLYWSDAKGGVYKMPSEGGTPVDLFAPDLNTNATVRRLATDERYRWWSNYDLRDKLSQRLVEIVQSAKLPGDKRLMKYLGRGGALGFVGGLVLGIASLSGPWGPIALVGSAAGGGLWGLLAGGGAGEIVNRLAGTPSVDQLTKPAFRALGYESYDEARKSNPRAT